MSIDNTGHQVVRLYDYQVQEHSSAAAAIADHWDHVSGHYPRPYYLERDVDTLLQEGLSEGQIREAIEFAWGSPSVSDTRRWAFVLRRARVMQASAAAESLRRRLEPVAVDPHGPGYYRLRAVVRATVLMGIALAMVLVCSIDGWSF